MIKLPIGLYNLPAYFVDREIDRISKISVAISESSGQYALYQSQVDFVAQLENFEGESEFDIKQVKLSPLEAATKSKIALNITR